MQHDEVNLQTIATDPDPDLDEMHVDDAGVTCHTGAHTILHMLADGQHMGSIHVKVDTRDGGNIMPLDVCWYLCPTQIRPDGIHLAYASHQLLSKYTMIRV